MSAEVSLRWGGWGRRWTSGVLQGRQQHLHTVEAGDWRSIISLCCYFKTGVSLSTGGHRVRDQTDKHDCHVSNAFDFSCAPLIRAAEKQWPAESKQQAQSQFTSSDISVILHRGHTLQWLMSSILGGCLTITHRAVMPVLTNARCIAAWVMGFINLVSLREELHYIYCECCGRWMGGKSSFILVDEAFLRSHLDKQSDRLTSLIIPPIRPESER